MRDLEKDKEICDRATPGPWGKTQSEGDCSGWNCPRNMKVCDEDCLMCEEYEIYKGVCLEGPDYIEIGDYSYFTDKDAEFIAAAREGWPEAITRATKAEYELTLLRKVAEAGEKAIKTLDKTCYLFAKADDRAIHNEAVKMFWQALAELDKEGNKRIKCNI